MMKVRKVCKTCGTVDIVKDAWAVWDEDEQYWVLDDVFDYTFCRNCEGETNEVDEPLKEGS